MIVAYYSSLVSGGGLLIPIVSFVGKSNVGKTTLLEKVVAELKRRGYRVATLKHDTHGFDIDKPGKDTWRMAQAGSDPSHLLARQGGPHRPHRPRPDARRGGKASWCKAWTSSSPRATSAATSRRSRFRAASAGASCSAREEELLAWPPTSPTPSNVPQFGLDEGARRAWRPAGGEGDRARAGRGAWRCWWTASRCR